MPEEITLDQAIGEVLRSPGFVVFMAFIDPASEIKNPQIQFRYFRDHFSIDDLPECSRQFKSSLNADIDNSQKNIKNSLESV